MLVLAVIEQANIKFTQRKVAFMKVMFGFIG